MATRYPNRDYGRRRSDPGDREEERDGMWVGVADKERRGRLDDRIRERSSKRPLWPSLDRSGEPRAGDVMTSDVCTIHFSDSVENAARAMVRRDCGALPVVDDRDRVVGVVSQADLARHAGAFPGHGERRAFADVIFAVSEPTPAPYR